MVTRVFICCHGSHPSLISVPVTKYTLSLSLALHRQGTQDAPSGSHVGISIHLLFAIQRLSNTSWLCKVSMSCDILAVLGLSARTGLKGELQCDPCYFVYLLGLDVYVLQSVSTVANRSLQKVTSPCVWLDYRSIQQELLGRTNSPTFLHK
jgi:hypothetical protein